MGAPGPGLLKYGGLIKPSIHPYSGSSGNFPNFSINTLNSKRHSVMKMFFFQVMIMPCFEGKISLWIHKMYIFWKLQLINTPGWAKFASCRQLEFLSENAKFCSSTYLINKSNPSSDFWWIQLLVGGITILHNIVPWFSWKCLASKFASLQGISNYLNL